MKRKFLMVTMAIALLFMPNVKAIAYAGDTITATGTVPKWGTIAVDPTAIPYGTKVYIPEFGKVFVAEDCGSAIKGNRIDIFMATEEDRNEWRVKDIDIHVLS
jgi:3D (Asp-Asp-Asp) domain-containing protein